MSCQRTDPSAKPPTGGARGDARPTFITPCRLAGDAVHLIPNHRREAEMLEAIGAPDVASLFEAIPAHLRIDGLELPAGEPEHRLLGHLRRVLGRNQGYHNMPVFLGGGAKPQVVPTAVQDVIHRQELKNAYTPYQPEVSQGLLQSLFEYQSLMADLTRMEVVNASMYDWATALGEAALMCIRNAREPERRRFLVPAALSWPKRSVLENYGRGVGLQVEPFAFDDATGEADMDDLEARLQSGGPVAGVYVENPNHFGVFETNAAGIARLAQDAGALAVMGVDPTSLGVVTPPGHLGADIVVGEGSSFGGVPALGGPHVGLFATREALVRKMPGRLIGATRDEDGKRGYVMTLQAREQHIRRSKATSNICSNEALIANQAAMHLAMLGRSGLRTMGLQNLEAGRRLADTLASAGLEPRFSGAHYNEFVTRVPGEGPDALHEHLLRAGVHGGLRLARDVPALADCTLWGATPVHEAPDFQALRDALQRGVPV